MDVPGGKKTPFSGSSRAGRGPGTRRRGLDVGLLRRHQASIDEGGAGGELGFTRGHLGKTPRKTRLLPNKWF